MYHLTPYAFSGFLAGVSSLIFGVFVYLKSPNRKLGKIWFLFAFSVAVYGFGGLWMGSVQNMSKALLAWRVDYGFGVVWIAAFFYHFVCIFCEIERSRSILIHYLISLAFFFTVPTPFFFRGVWWAFDSFYYSEAG